MNAQKQTHFGFETIDWNEKTRRVGEVFSGVASNYDLMNDAMSFGLHRLWKREFISMLNPQHHWKHLDVAGGTGDISFGIRKRCNAQITLCDINAEMLSEGRDRAIDKNIHGIEFVCGNAECLPLPSGQFDAYTIAFGIRNVTDIPAALREAHRTLKHGGRFMCLEFSAVAVPWLAKLYDTYSFHMIPKIGKLLAGNEDAYQYLVESIRQFPNQQTFASMIEEAGFEHVSYRNLTGGVVAIHSGWKM